jgi:hypothetical protein
MYHRVHRVSRDNYGSRARSLLNDDIELSGEMNGSAPGGSLVRSHSVGSSSSSATSNGAADSAGLIPLEICFHVKEAWNIFEVRFLKFSAPSAVFRRVRLRKSQTVQ